MKLLVFSPHCSDKSGHYFAYYSSLERICNSLGWSAVFLISRKNILINTPNYQRWFHSQQNKIVQGIFRIFDYFRGFQFSDRETMYMLESYSLLDLFSFTIASIISRKKKCLLFFIRDGMEAYPKKQVVFFSIIKLLARIYKDRFWLLTDSELIQQSYLNTFGLDIHVFPIPHTSKCMPLKKRSSSRVKIWIPGSPNPSRGQNINIECCWILTSSDTDMNLYLSDQFAPMIPKDKRTIFLPYYLDEESYARLHSESTFIFLLYDSMIYASRTSGIFVEAVISGTFVLVLEGGWLAFELKKFNLYELILSKDEITPAFVGKLAEIANSEIVRKKFLIMSEQYRRYHNEKTYQEKMKSLFFKKRNGKN